MSGISCPPVEERRSLATSVIEGDRTSSKPISEIHPSPARQPSAMKATILLLSLCEAACLKIPLAHIKRRAVLMSPAALLVGIEAAQARQHAFSAEGSWSPYRDFLVGPEKARLPRHEGHALLL